MADNLDLKFKLSTVGGDKVNKAFKASNAEIKKLNKEVNSTGATGAKAFKKSTDSVKKMGAEVKRTNSFLTSTKGLLTGFFSLAAGTALASSILDVNREMESLRAQLKSLTGSSSGAEKAFKFIQDFAEDTPFQIKGLTKAFIDLKNFGIEPTGDVMKAITNQASKLGASQETLSGITLALGQSYAKGKLQAEEMLQLVERGVPVYKLLAEATGRNSDELSEMASKGLLGRDVIDQLIIKMGEMAKGSNADAMNTLNGSISKLSSSWHRFEDTLLNDKSEGFIKQIVSGWTEIINGVTNGLTFGHDLNQQLIDVNDKIFDARKNIEDFKSAGVFETVLQSGIFGDTLAGEENQLRILLKLRNEIIDNQNFSDEQGEFDAILNQGSALAKKQADDNQKDISFAKQQAELADKAIQNLQRQIDLSGAKTEQDKIQYETTLGSLKNIAEIEKERLLTLAAQKDAVRGVADEYKKSGSDARGNGGSTKESGNDAGANQKKFGQVRTTAQVLNEIAGKSLEQIQQETFSKQKNTDSNNALLQERLRFEGKTNDPRFNPDFKQDARFSDSSPVNQVPLKFNIDEQQAINAATSVNKKVGEYLEANPLKQIVEMVFTNTENGATLDSEALACGTR